MQNLFSFMFLSGAEIAAELILSENPEADAGFTVRRARRAVVTNTGTSIGIDFAPFSVLSDKDGEFFIPATALACEPLKLTAEASAAYLRATTNIIL